jgi:hypothetical protein
MIGNRTRDRPAYSILPQPTALPRASVTKSRLRFIHSWYYLKDLNQHIESVNAGYRFKMLRKIQDYFSQRSEHSSQLNDLFRGESHSKCDTREGHVHP